MTTAAKPPATALTMTNTVTIRKMTAGFMKHDAFLPRIAGMVVGSLLPRRTHSLYFLIDGRYTNRSVGSSLIVSVRNGVVSSMALSVIVCQA